MKYETILETIKNIIENDLIEKKGLTLVYELDELEHFELESEIFALINGASSKYRRSDVFEIKLDGILVKFIKKTMV